MNRNHYMALGTILLLIGATIFKIDAVTLNEESTKFLAQQLETPAGEGGLLASTATVKKTIPIPTWPRFLCISLGAILMLHAIGMAKPGG
jgi:hypothetical protein